MEFLASAPDIDDTDQVAIDHEECSICFDSLFSRQASFFLNRNKKRICRHYFHTVVIIITLDIIIIINIRIVLHL